MKLRPTDGPTGEIVDLDQYRQAIAPHKFNQFTRLTPPEMAAESGPYLGAWLESSDPVISPEMYSYLFGDTQRGDRSEPFGFDPKVRWPIPVTAPQVFFTSAPCMHFAQPGYDARRRTRLHLPALIAAVVIGAALGALIAVMPPWWL